VEIWPFEIIQDGGLAACSPLGFDVTGNNAIRSVDPENPALETIIGSPVAEIWPFTYLGTYGTPIFGEGGHRGVQRWHHSKEQWWFPIGSPL